MSSDLDRLVEAGARSAAKCSGLDYDEVCGVEADPDKGYCDSSTCVAAYFEEHDPDYARGYYKSQARAAILAILPLLADDLAGVINPAWFPTDYNHRQAVNAIRTRLTALAQRGEGL